MGCLFSKKKSNQTNPENGKLELDKSQRSHGGVNEDNEENI